MLSRARVVAVLVGVAVLGLPAAEAAGETPEPPDSVFSGPPNCASVPPPTPARIDAPEAGAQSSDEAIQTVRAVLPAALESGSTASLAGLAPALRRVGTGVEATGSLLDVRIASEPTLGFSMGTGPGGVCFAPTRVSDEAKPGVLVGNGAMVFANSDQATTTVVRPTATGAETFTVLNDASAPREFSWHVEVGEGQRLVTLADGSVAVVNPRPESVEGESTSLVNTGLDALEPVGAPADTAQAQAAAVGQTGAELAKAHQVFGQAQNSTGDEIVLVFPKPWALDARGIAVPVALREEGSILTMTVDPDSSSTFPIIADPAPTASAARQGGPMRLMTFNIRSGQPLQSGVKDPDVGKHNDHTERVITILLRNLRAFSAGSLVPGAVGLQEVCSYDFARLLLRLNQRDPGPDATRPRWRGDFQLLEVKPDSCPYSGGYGNAIIRSARRTAGDTQAFPRAYTESLAAGEPVGSELRGYMRTQVDVNSRRVEFFTTHLPPTPVKLKQRMARELSDRAIGFSNPRAVTGDFNATPGSLTMKPNFYDRGFYEVDQCDNAATFAGAKIDYIFLKGLPRVCNGRVVRVTDPTSDHDTLVASTDV